MVWRFPAGTVESVRMTDLSVFGDDELADVLAAPKAVMEGAIVADGAPNALRFLKELTAAAKVFKEAQRHRNALVKAVANRLRERDVKEPRSEGLLEQDEAIAKALGTTERALAALRERAGQEDFDAYGAWLVRIATKVAEAARSKSGGFFSKKVAVSDGEREFIERLEALIAR